MNAPEVRVSYLPLCTWHTSVPVWRFHYWSTHVDLQMRQICIPLTTPHTKAKLILVWKKWSHINLLIHSKKTHEERVPHMHIWPINVTWYTTSALLTSGPARQTSMRFLWSCFGENEPASTVNNFAPHDQWTLVTPPPHHKHKAYPPLRTHSCFFSPFKSVGQSWTGLFLSRAPAKAVARISERTMKTHDLLSPIYHGRERTVADVCRVLTSTVTELNSRGLNLLFTRQEFSQLFFMATVVGLCCDLKARRGPFSDEQTLQTFYLHCY